MYLHAIWRSLYRLCFDRVSAIVTPVRLQVSDKNTGKWLNARRPAINKPYRKNYPNCRVYLPTKFLRLTRPGIEIHVLSPIGVSAVLPAIGRLRFVFAWAQTITEEGTMELELAINQRRKLPEFSKKGGKRADELLPVLSLVTCGHHLVSRFGVDKFRHWSVCTGVKPVARRLNVDYEPPSLHWGQTAWLLGVPGTHTPPLDVQAGDRGTSFVSVVKFVLF